ncbi:MAG: hypothetical protein RL329_2358, partial [Bacteroidota bacterium]
MLKCVMDAQRKCQIQRHKEPLNNRQQRLEGLKPSKRYTTKYYTTLF